MTSWSTGMDVPCRLCEAFFDSQMEQRVSGNTAEATRGRDACVNAPLGGLKLAGRATMTTEPRGLTEPTSFRLTFPPPRLSQASSNVAVARGLGAQAAFEKKQHTTGVKSVNCTSKILYTDQWYEQPIAGPAQPSPEQCIMVLT